MTKLFTSIVASLTLISSTFAVSPLAVHGSDFVNTVDGSRFQILGVAYQPGGSSGFDPSSGVDPLSDSDACLRDATLLQRLGVNTIRVYNVDPDLDHAACASIFNAAGIYMIVDVNSPLPGQSLDRGAPWTTYDVSYLTRVFQVVEAFMDFNNTLGYFSGNEVINQDATYEVPAYVRAVTRDVKDYVKAQAPRAIPVGYSAADVRPLLFSTWAYMSCGLSNSTDSVVDFFGLNSYSWCGNSTFSQSTYDQLIAGFSNTTTPIFFSEYGCNVPAPRVFTEVPVLYSDQMTPVFSGGLVYQYTEETNNYGLVNINSNNTVSILQDYDTLQTRYNSLDAKALEASNSTATSLQPPTCDPSLITASGFQNDWDIPGAPDGTSELISNGVANKTTYRVQFVKVNSTTPSQAVYDVNGQELQGLKLNILANDQSNLPGNNTSGTEPSGTGSPTQSSASPTKTHNAAAAVRFEDARLGSLVLGVLTFGFFMHL